MAAPTGWEEVSRWCIRTPDWRYTITKYGIADEEYRYELWKGKKSLAHNLPSAAAAIELWAKEGSREHQLRSTGGTDTNRAPREAEAQADHC